MMTGNPYTILKGIDSSILAPVVQHSLDLPDFHLIDWSVQPLAHHTVIETTGGLFLFRGRGWDAAAGGQAGEPAGAMRPWSVVLKIVLPPGEDCREPGELCYWRREALAYQSGLLADLPGSLRAPRCIGVTEHSEDGKDSTWIWLEYVKDRSGPAWSLSDYQRAARALGEFAGGYLTGRPVPDFPWLCRSLFRAMYAGDGWWARFIDPNAAKNAWQRKLVQAVFPGAMRERVLRIWEEKEQFLTANDRLPRIFCHNDAHRGNLFVPGNLPGENIPLVALDWGFCGPGGLGNDLGELVGGSLSHFAGYLTGAEELEAAVLEGYAAGLRDAGWEGDLRLARLGYLVSLSLYWGGTLPHEVAQADDARETGEFRHGRPAEELLPGWKHLAAFALDRADEAREGMRRLL